MRDQGPVQERSVDRYFDREASYWRDVYDQTNVQGRVYRRRMELAMRWVDEADLAPDSPVLDIGCGAGLVSVELARRGLAVTGVDSSAEMVALLSQRAADEHLDARVQAQQADVRELPFGSREFKLVIGLGVLPWLDDPWSALREMARVLAPGGWAILTADNRSRLNLLVEPRESPLLAPLRVAYGALKRNLGNSSGRGAPSFRHLPREVDRMLVGAGLSPVRRATIGYGPFTFMGRPLLGAQTAIRVNDRLELASATRTSLRRAGWHYVVAARKSLAPETGPANA